ncbi:permease [Clostridium sp. BSD9I1]|uniref:permease n=1 Tax=Clostridium sp. BSD9I1 TaxID=2003589 RepID=UPI001648DCE5|nr:permease [Clostridium sp. BSD9I1]
MSSLILYISAAILLMLSYSRDKNKTKEALIKSLKSFENIMPQFLGIIFIVGIMLALLKPEIISTFIGKNSGALGVFLSSIIGSITMMPTFVAFPTADMLLKSGAGYAQVGALVSTLTLVGVITLPLESKYIGKKAAFLRNFVAFLFSFIVALIIGWAFK